MTALLEGPDPHRTSAHASRRWSVALALLLGVFGLGDCRCGDRGGGSTSGNAPVVFVDPDEVGRPKPVDEIEPNDTIKKAQELPLDRGISGQLTEKEGGDEDWYRVQVQGQQQILTTTLTGVAGLDLVLEAWSEKRERLVRVNNSREGEGEILVNLAVDQGTTYLRVREGKNRSASGRYRLSVAIRAREEGEEREPNWKAGLASTLPLEGEVSGYLGWHTDTDWYRVDLTRLLDGARIRVEFDGLDEVRANLSLRTGAGTILQERWSGPGEAIVFPNITVARGTSELFVVLRCQYHFNVESRYSLRASSAIPPGPTEAEPNDTSVDATPLSVGTSIAGLLVDSIDRDLYSIRVSQPGAFQVQVVPPIGVDVALALLDESGKVVTEVDQGAAREPEFLTAIGARPPRAIIQVRAPQRQSVSAMSPYHLRVEALLDGVWEREPNDTVPTSFTWPFELTEVKAFLHPKNDVDLYRIQVRPGQRVRFIASGAGTLRLKLELLDLNGSTMVSSSAPDAMGLVSVETQPAIEVLLRVSEATGASSARVVYWLKRENL